ncbi:MAG: BlaI/MecI/CopY family transcriptional regulator [Oscillospiraceae bacterium]|jgi:Predicted transcriptional regulator|nr:BlaI/MecI/CopY family transcriptional regulator [Oscillospiraceae bacterium]
MKNPLSPNEFKIMQLLWKEDRPLSRPEIIELTPERDWNPNSIHLILNNMIEKGVIQVEGMTRCGRGYGRTYAATMTNMEYAKSLLEESTPELTPDERILGLLPLLLQDEIQPQTRTAVKKMLDKR